MNLVKKIHSQITVVLIMALVACGNTGAVAAVTGVGLAGVALTVYCATPGNCTPQVAAFGPLVTAEATRDVAILDTAEVTVEQLEKIAASLFELTVRGQLIPDPPPQLVGAIAAVQAVLPLIQALINPSTGSVTASRSPIESRKIKLPPLTQKDREKIANMQRKIEAIK